jgi:hypothetical protein
MDTILAEQGLKLTYLRDPSTSEAFDPCRILDDLYEESMPGAVLPWRNWLRIIDGDHLVLATGTGNGRCRAALAASDLATDREPFLLLDAAYCTPVANASHLLQRMLALAMLRIAGDAAVPTVIAACVRTPSDAHSLRNLCQRFTGAASFPGAPDDRVIDLGMASLARRIARAVRPASRYDVATGIFCPRAAARYGAGIQGGCSGTEETLVVIDLSAAGEAAILDTARKLYRAWPRRRARHGAAIAVARTASHAQRGLRDATGF